MPHDADAPGDALPAPNDAHRDDAVLDRVADAHVLFDPALRYLAVNPAAERSMQRPRPALLGRTLTEAFPSAAGSVSERHYHEVAATGREAHWVEHYVGDGLDVWVEVDAYPTGHGPAWGVAVFWRDVTARVRADQARDEAVEALAARNAALLAQQAELEHANQLLQDQAAELELSSEALQATAIHLEDEMAARGAALAGLAESEARLQFALAAADLGTWDLDLTTDLAAVRSLRHDQMFGYAELQPTWGHGVAMRHVLPDDRPVLDAAYQRALETGVLAGVEVRVRWPDGSVHWIAPQGRVTYDDAGRPVRMAGVVADVTARREAEAARAAQGRQLRAVLEQMPVGVIVVAAPSGRPIAANRQIHALLGYHADDVELEGYSVAYAGWRPDGTRYAAAEWPVARALLTGETVHGEPIRMRRADGTMLDAEVSAAPVRDDAGTIVAAVVTVADVSARTEAAAERERLLAAERAARAALALERDRLRRVFEEAPSFVVAYGGPDAVFEFHNEAYAELIGHRPVLGRPLLEALPEVRAQGFKALLDQVRESGTPWVGREVPVVFRPDPAAPPVTRYVDLVFHPRVEPDGTRSGVIVHGSDVTVQVAARRETERLLAEAEAANRSKSEFLANMSHELRTPLNAIQGHTQLLAMELHGPVTERQRVALGRIERAQQHLLGLINDVLNYARLEAGRVEYVLDPVELGPALVDVTAMLAPQLATAGLTLHLAPVDAAPPVWADREKLAQVLLNLLSNAVKFTPAGGRVTVATHAAPDAPELVQVRVQDTGIGVPAEKLEAIFEPFVQVNGGRTRTHEGTGLGLSISRDLARGMGGDLAAESTLGAGATFTLTLRRTTSATGAPVDRRSHAGRRRDAPDRRSGTDRREGGAPDRAGAPD